jgi:hypothetical protein
MVLARLRWYAACLLGLIFISIVPAFSAFLSRNAPAGAGSTPSSYRPLCGGSLPTCAYAFSTERQLVSGATTALTVYRSVDGTTQNIGFTGGLVNTAAVDAFCNASVAGVISRSCLLAGVIDQTGNCADGITEIDGNPSHMPTYMVWPAHSNLPVYQVPYVGSTRVHILENGPAIGSGSSPPGCNSALTGGPQSLYGLGSTVYISSCCGEGFGVTETAVPNGGSPHGSMFSPFFAGDSTVQCTVACTGVDIEGAGISGAVPLGIDTESVSTAAGGRGFINVYANGTQIVTNATPAVSLLTQTRLTLGADGDRLFNGPLIWWDGALYSSQLSSAQVAAIHSNTAAFLGMLKTGDQGPGDLFTQASSTVTGGRVDQLQYLSQCFSLRKCYAGYEGPAINVCQGSGACEDIGWVGDIIDTATMSAFCGPVSGLNNCAVQIWYNEALTQSTTGNGVGMVDATAVSSTNRPTISWSGCQTTNVPVCIATSSDKYFTAVGIIVSSAAYSMSAVATRTSGASLSAVYAGASGPATFIGFGAANTCEGSATNGGGFVTVACNDNTIHSITVDAVNSPSAATTVYADGTTGGTNTSAILYQSSTLGVGAVGNGTDPCTCQFSEVLVFADAHSASLATALGSSNVAILRANQRAVFGF